jgi:hypothetical protein
VGGRSLPRAHHTALEGEALARKTGDVRMVGLAMCTRCLVLYLMGSWRTALDDFVEAEELLLRECPGTIWELANTRLYLCSTLMYLGRFNQLSRRFDRYLAEASRLGNTYVTTSLRTKLNIVWLARDEPERAGAEIAGVLDTWPAGSYQLQHSFHLYARCDQALYVGDGQRALRELDRELPDLERTLLMRIQLTRIEITFYRARAGLAAAAAATDPRQRGRFLKLARRAARRLRREKLAFATAWAGLVEVTATWLARGPSALEMRPVLDDAIGKLTAVDCALFAAAARRGKGLIVGGDEGSSLVQEAETWMRASGISNPGRMSGLLAPGLGTR